MFPHITKGWMFAIEIYCIQDVFWFQSNSNPNLISIVGTPDNVLHIKPAFHSVIRFWYLHTTIYTWQCAILSDVMSHSFARALMSHHLRHHTKLVTPHKTSDTKMSQEEPWYSVSKKYIRQILQVISNFLFFLCNDTLD